MKNPTSGDLSVMMNSIVAAQAGHTFLYRGWEVETPGNDYAHAILRGAVNQHGQNLPNYHYEDLMRLYELYQEKDYKNPAVIVDCNHHSQFRQAVPRTGAHQQGSAAQLAPFRRSPGPLSKG